MDRRKLPIGIQTFRQIREEGYYYVDKTAWARRLADDAGKHYFLSRPRRFGKSLFVDTLKELYEGNEALFRGLSVHDGWDWSKRHPVVRLDFSSGDFFDPDELPDNLTEQFDALESEYAAESGYDRAPIRFRRLLRELHRRTGRRVVVLVDEYDKPILDAIDSPTTRGTGRACSTRSSRHRWTAYPWRTPRAGGGWTWRCGWAGTCTCSSSRWRSAPGRAEPWRRCRRGAAPTSTALRTAWST